jgi:hypothetical protein
LKLRYEQKLKLEEEERSRQDKARKEREAAEKAASEKAEKEAIEKARLGGRTKRRKATKAKTSHSDMNPARRSSILSSESDSEHISDNNSPLKKRFSAVVRPIIDDPVKLFGYTLSFVFFGLFLLADTIIIANALVLMALISPDLPPILQRMDFSILAGVVLSPVIGIRALNEISGKRKLFFPNRLSESQKLVYKILSISVIVCSLIMMISIAIQKLVLLGFIQTSSAIDLILSFTTYGIFPINSSICAALTFESAAPGVIAVTYLLNRLFRLAIQTWQR